MKGRFWKSSENLFVVTCFVLSGLAFLSIGALVAPPKMLFGEALTAIAPSIFPQIVLGLLALLCGFHLIHNFRLQLFDADDQGIVGWRRGAVFFSIMTIYALVLVPIGFILSSSVALAVLSWFTGNRSVLQISLVSMSAPVLLYLGATRLLAVSLPELNTIELLISKVLGG